MMSLNVVFLTGRIAQQLDLRYTPAGNPVVDVVLAVDGVGKDGGRQAQFFDLTVWGPSAESLCKYKDKGDFLAVKGRLQKDIWEANGQKMSKIKVVVNEIDYGPKTHSSDPEEGVAGGIDFNDEEIPF